MSRLAPALRTLLDVPDEARRLGPFRLVRQLGRGGFAPVWLAKEVYGTTELRLAAVKLFAVEEPRGKDHRASKLVTAYRDRVIEEARALCRVEHPGIVRFYSIASDESRGVIGVAMEYLTGTSLEAVLLSSGKLSVDATLAVGASVASALSAVHRAGLVHRDVKPANVIDSGGAYKLIDFGISAAEAPERPTKPVLVDDLPLEVSAAARRKISGAVTIATSSGDSAPTSLAPRGGTVGYVDPACIASGAAANASSDLYALGVMLFECLAGVHPAAVGGAPGEGLREAVLRGERPAPALAEVAPHVPSALGALVDSLLSPAASGRPASAEWVAIELERIRGEAAGMGRERPPESVGPFRGLGRFEGADRDVYFGRATEIAAALELLRTRGTVALVGPSGSGKSSLARAGVLPRITDGSLGRWPPEWDSVVAVPGADPVAAIKEAIATLPDAPALAPGASPSAVAESLAERAQTAGRGVVLVLDQLEELVTIADPEGARWAAALLARLGESPIAGVRALVAARRDLLDPLLALEGLGTTLVRGSLLVEPMNDATWMDVLVQALAAYGYTLEDEKLHQELRAELKGSAGAMPLVQFALTELWNKRDTETKKVTRAGLRAIGGIAGSLERHAEATVARLVRDEPRAEPVIRELLLALTTPQGTRATRTVADLGHAGDPVWKRVVTALEDARLVVRGADEVTLAHEALLSQWHRLRTWVAEARDDRLLAEEVDRDAQRWRQAPELAPLWKGRRLALAEDVRQRRAVLTTAASTFVDASRRAARRSRLAGATAAAIVLAVLGATGFAYVRAVQASERTALEKAAVEGQKAALEQQKRASLEEAQAEIDRRQSQIDDLVKKLASDEDPTAAVDVKRQIREAQSDARAARAKIAAALPPRPASPTIPAGVPAAAAPPTPEPVPAAPAIKVQRE